MIKIEKMLIADLTKLRGWITPFEFLTLVKEGEELFLLRGVPVLAHAMRDETTDNVFSMMRTRVPLDDVDNYLSDIIRGTFFPFNPTMEIEPDKMTYLTGPQVEQVAAKLADDYWRHEGVVAFAIAGAPRVTVIPEKSLPVLH